MDGAISPPDEVQTVTITAARLPDAQGLGAFSFVRIDPEALAAARRLDEALGQVPGAALFRRTSSLGANPTIQGVSLRNIAPSGAGRALVTLDSVPQNDPFGGWVIWTALPPEGLEGVSIVRGAGAGPYGAGALTGVVALEEHGETQGLAAADISLADTGSGRTAASAGLGGVLVTGAAETGEGYVPLRGAGRGAVDTETSLDSWSLSARYQLEFAGGLGAVRVGAYEEERGGGVEGLTSGASGNVASLTFVRPPGVASYGWRIQGWYRESNLQNTFLSVAAGRASATPASTQYATPASGWGANAALRQEGDAWSWEIGADARLYDGETQEQFRNLGAGFTRGRWAGGEAMIAGVYAEAMRERGAWLFTGGARLDAWSNSEGFRLETDLATGLPTLEVDQEDRDGLIPTARLGARYTLGEMHFLRAAAYAGFRAATLNELHRPFRVGNDITEANAALKPERLYGVEFGASGEGIVHWQGTLFYNRLVDPITNVTIGAGPGTFPVAGFVPAGGVLRQRQNAGAIDAIGFEGEIGGEITSALRWNGALLWTWARVDGDQTAPQLDEKEPAQTPRIAVTLGADWHVDERLTLGGTLRFEGKRFEDDQNERVLSHALMANLRLGWKFSQKIELYAGADNLFDADVEIGESADGLESYAAPRMFRIGMTYRQ
jgi:vitamin B12 transporter